MHAAVPTSVPGPTIATADPALADPTRHGTTDTGVPGSHREPDERAAASAAPAAVAPPKPTTSIPKHAHMHAESAGHAGAASSGAAPAGVLEVLGSAMTPVMRNADRSVAASSGLAGVRDGSGAGGASDQSSLDAGAAAVASPYVKGGWETRCSGLSARRRR